jgi:hypothetical protein
VESGDGGGGGVANGQSFPYTNTHMTTPDRVHFQHREVWRPKPADDVGHAGAGMKTLLIKSIWTVGHRGLWPMSLWTVKYNI